MIKREEQILQFFIDSKKNYTTMDISDEFSIRRNQASQYLNNLVREGKLLKTTNRPVQYQLVDLHESQVFEKIIGHDQSLSRIIEQCKSSVHYPPKGLPILLTGDTGVGKSHLAKLIYRYALEIGAIEQSAQFVTFNCADYANNEELLTAKLFGYVKGAFSGAESDQSGIVEAANGGYLFLDEVHRLSPVGQEKLFLLLDQGIYQPLGENSIYKNISLRIICATTEQIHTTLMDTFIRRIPIILHLPALSERSLEEKMHFIRNFYIKESNQMNLPILVEKNVINHLISKTFNGNIGELSNIIKVSCANAYRRNDGLKPLTIESYDIQDDNTYPHEERSYFLNKHLEVFPNSEQNELSSQYLDWPDQTYETVHNLLACCKELSLNQIDLEEFYQKSTQLLYDLYAHKTTLSSPNVNERLLKIHVQNELKVVENKYGVRFDNKSDDLLTSILLFSSIVPSEYLNQCQDECKLILSHIKRSNYRWTYISNTILENLEFNFDYTSNLLSKALSTIFMYIQLKSIGHNQINAIIIAHGSSTASSIASAVNQLLQSYVFESLDMSLDLRPSEIFESIKKLSMHFNEANPLIFLVDMGSLLDVYSYIKEDFKNDIAIINNITTQIALNVGNLIMQNSDMLNIIDSVVRNNQIQYKYYQGANKKKVIITTCATGIGTSNKIKNMIENCIPGEDIRIISCDFHSLKNLGKKHEVFAKYDVECIITTLNFEIDGVDIILFSDFLDNDNLYIRKTLSRVFGEEKVNGILNNLVKMLTLENIISRLTILNPNKIIQHVNRVISKIEQQIGTTFQMNLRLTLCIHISIMIERMILSKDTNQENLTLQNRNIDTTSFPAIKKIIENELQEYHIPVPDDEIIGIIQIIENF